jgi:hypothetical protein
VWAAGLFFVHLAVICWLAFGKGLAVLRRLDSAPSDDSTTPGQAVEKSNMIMLASGSAVLTLLSGVVSFLWLRFTINSARGVIHCMLVTSIVTQLAMAAWGGIMGDIILVIVGIAFAAITLW